MKRLLIFLGTVLLILISHQLARAQQSFETGFSSDLGETYIQQFKSLSPAEREEAIKALKESGGKLTPEIIQKISPGTPPPQGETTLKTGKEAPSPSTQKELSAQKTVTAEKKESLFVTYWKSTPESKILSKLKPFGYELFKRPAPQAILAQPVPPDYIIGPGDEIQVLIWGRINKRYALTVQPDGTILFPELGPLNVAGMRYQEMKRFLTDQVKRITGANVAVNIAQLRKIQVFVLGEVKKPGPYLLPAMSTMLDALIQAGGPTPRGSLRRIVLKREEKIISQLDVYQLLLKGDKSRDKILRHGDVIFVPLAGPLVGVTGNVKRPAVYELYRERTLSEVIRLAGGLLPTAWSQRIQVERAEKNLVKVVLDIKARNAETLQKFLLKDGDLIKIFPIIPQPINEVQLKGHVWRPGVYAWKPGMRLSQLLSKPEDLLPEAYLDYGLIERLVMPTREIKLIPFSPRKLLIDKDPKADLPLLPYDKVYVFSKWELAPKPVVKIEGEVRNPGSYALKENDFRIKDLIMLAGGLTNNAYLKKGELYRTDKKKLKTVHLTFNVEKALKGDPQHNLLLQDKDRIVIHSIEEFLPPQTVSISGEVNKPGDYPYCQGLRVKDLVFMGGNLKDSAYLKEAELISFEIKNGQKVEIARRTINLAKALAGDPQNNVLLRPYDRLMVKRIPDWGEYGYVEILGEVRFPGKYLIHKGERLSSLIERAGGFTEKAYLPGAIFTRRSLKAKQQEMLNKMVERLERELLAAGGMAVARGLSKESIEAQKGALEARQKFIQSLKKLEAQGRMAIHLAPLRLLKHSEYDIPLEDGDRLYIPTNPGVINVIGAVMSPGSYVYSTRHGVKDYIAMAGGLTQYADKDRIYILRVDGSAQKASSKFIRWNPLKSRWEVGAFSRKHPLMPGDTIVVPEKLEYIYWLGEVRDITQILMNIAVTTGTIINLW